MKRVVAAVRRSRCFVSLKYESSMVVPAEMCGMVDNNKRK